MNRLLEVENLQVSFHTYAGEVKAVRGITFGVEKGETLALVGESGCGKSVTAKALLRLFDSTSGEIMPGSKIQFDGQDVMALNKKQLHAFRGAEIGMIFQDPMTSLDPTMSIGKQVEDVFKDRYWKKTRGESGLRICIRSAGREYSESFNSCRRYGGT